MIYEVIWTSRFKKGYKLCKKRGLPLEELKTVVAVLQKNRGILTLTLVDTGTHSDLFKR